MKKKYDRSTMEAMLTAVQSEIQAGVSAAIAAEAAGFTDEKQYRNMKYRFERTDGGSNRRAEPAPGTPTHAESVTAKTLLLKQMQKLHDRTTAGTPIDDMGKLTIAMVKCAEQINTIKEDGSDD